MITVKEFPPDVSTDRRLDWLCQHDSKSENFPVRAVLPKRSALPKHKTWKTGAVLDQGYEGSCVGHGWTAELGASPRPVPNLSSSRGHQYAVELYNEAKRIDEWDGEAYDGTSVLAGAKVVKSRGFIGEYRWAFSVEDVRDAVLAEGPVVIGIPWYEDMYSTRKSGLVEVGGPLVGGHCLLITGYHPEMRIYGENWETRHNVFRWRNSWGVGYGVKGDGFIRLEDLRDLLREWGEACVPMQRKKTRI